MKEERKKNRKRSDEGKTEKRFAADPKAEEPAVAVGSPPGGADPVRANAEKRDFGKQRSVFGVRVSSLLLNCYLASFLGWCVENAFRGISIGVLDDRHQLLPFLGAYGFGMFVLFAAFGTPSAMRFFGVRILPDETKKNRVLRSFVYCAVVFAIILLGEMGVGLAFEKLFGIQAWNYTNIPLHVTRYTSIPTTAGFTAMIYTVMEFIFPRLTDLFDKIPEKIAVRIAVVLGAMIAADYLVMLISGAVTGSFPSYWRIELPRSLRSLR